MTAGELLTRWTVRLALLCYVVTLALLLRRPAARFRAARGLWTVGCLLYVAHVAFAFHVFHAWSHAHAFRETARQTRELFGVSWGGGLYVNHLFTLVWLLDVARWWAIPPDRYPHRPRWATAAVHAFLAFMAFNGAVVFAHGATRLVGVAACIVLAVLGATRVARGRVAAPISRLA